MIFSLIHRIPGRARLRSDKPFSMQTAVMLADELELLGRSARQSTYRQRSSALP